VGGGGGGGGGGCGGGVVGFGGGVVGVGGWWGFVVGWCGGGGFGVRVGGGLLVWDRTWRAPKRSEDLRGGGKCAREGIGASFSKIMRQ